MPTDEKKKSAEQAEREDAAEAKSDPPPAGPKEFSWSRSSHTKPALMLAEFDSTGRVLHAAERLRDAGYTKFEAHTPFPVHGMDAAMGLPDSRLGWIVLTGGLTGLATAVVMIWWMNGVDYPLNIGGKPPFSISPSVPIMFELTVLFSAFATFFGMLALNRLPQHHHAVFESERFRAASDDRFFISIEVDDPKYHLERTRALLKKLHPTRVEIVDESGSQEDR